MKKIKTRFFYMIIHKDWGWFRIKGYGLRVANRNKKKAPFSIRNGYQKELRIGKWGIIILKPNR